MHRQHFMLWNFAISLTIWNIDEQKNYRSDCFFEIINTKWNFRRNMIWNSFYFRVVVLCPCRCLLFNCFWWHFDTPTQNIPANIESNNANKYILHISTLCACFVHRQYFFPRFARENSNNAHAFEFRNKTPVFSSFCKSLFSFSSGRK